MSQKRKSIQNRQSSFASVSEEFGEYWKETGRKVHGGNHSRGLRKTARPFDSKKPMHVVLKAERAQGALSMWKRVNKDYIQKIIRKHAEKCEISIYRFSNNGNHLHLAVRAKNKKLFQKFLRTVTGLIARFVLLAQKGRPASASGDSVNAIGTVTNGLVERQKKNQRKFWGALAFTRVTEWGQDFKNLTDYVLQNILEAAGVIPHQPRKVLSKKIPETPGH